MKKFNYSLFFCGIILISCENNTYESYHSFHHNGWSSDSIVYFKYTISDTTRRYDAPTVIIKLTKSKNIAIGNPAAEAHSIIGKYTPKSKATA